MNSYPVLSFTRVALSALGWLMAAVGLFYYIVYEAILEPNLPGHHFDFNDLMQLFAGIGLVGSGLTFVALSELLTVFVRIEVNTRKS